MLYTELNVGEKAYKLRLNTRDIINLESKLGCNPMAIFGNGTVLPTLTQIIYILHASLQAYQHGISTKEAEDIFDKWIADGNTMTEFYAVIIEIYKVSGIIPKDTEVEGKN